MQDLNPIQASQTRVCTVSKSQGIHMHVQFEKRHRCIAHQATTEPNEAGDPGLSLPSLPQLLYAYCTLVQ